MMQRRAMKFGYDQALEDAMLERIDWRHNGYELFNVSVFDETSRPVWHSQVAETNTLFMRRAMWRELGGFDPAFESPGGGFVNLDTWHRACHLPDARPVLLLGEATFHQFHGGVATNRPQREVVAFRDEYIRIRGEDYERPAVAPAFWGSFTVEPHEEEFLRERGRHPRERMLSGPMAGLLDVTDDTATPPSAGAAGMGSRMLTATRVRVVSSTRLVAAPRPPEHQAHPQVCWTAAPARCAPPSQPRPGSPPRLALSRNRSAIPTSSASTASTGTVATVSAPRSSPFGSGVVGAS